MSFKRLVFRSTRGKAYVHFFDLVVNEADKEHLGSFDHLVYIVVFEEGPHMRDKIKKICNSVSDNMFEIHRDDVTKSLIDYEQQKENTNLLIKQTRLQLKDFLLNINRLNDSN